MLVKKDIITAIAKNTGLTQSDVTLVLEQHGKIVIDGLKNSEEVAIIGLGKLAPSLRPGRKARNPRTGAEVDVLPSITVKFKVATAVKEALN